MPICPSCHVIGGGRYVPGSSGMPGSTAGTDPFTGKPLNCIVVCTCIQSAGAHLNSCELNAIAFPRRSVNTLWY